MKFSICHVCSIGNIHIILLCNKKVIIQKYKKINNKITSFASDQQFTTSILIKA